MVAGYTIRRTDSSGQEIWSKNLSFNAQSGQQCSDNGFIITGYEHLEQMEDVVLYKTDAWGEQEWIRTLIGPFYDYAYNVQQTQDEGYIIYARHYDYDAQVGGWLIKTDYWGDTQFIIEPGICPSGYKEYMQQTQDGEYIFIDYDSFEGNKDISIVKMGAWGHLKWSRNFGGSGDEEAYSIRQTQDQGYIIVGYTQPSYYEDKNVYLIKTDSEGRKEWIKEYGEGNNDLGTSVRQTADGGFIVTGNTYYFGTKQNDIFLLKTDPDGNEEWMKTFGGSGDDLAYCVQEISAGGYIIAGSTKSSPPGELKSWLVYYNPVGEENFPPNKPTLTSPANNSIVSSNLVTFTWINNGDPDNDPVGSWLYAVGPWGQSVSIVTGEMGFEVGQEISYQIVLPSGQDWAWTIYIYDPEQNSDPFYSFQDPFWTFTIINQ